jgi:hypothetical protein
MDDFERVCTCLGVCARVMGYLAVTGQFWLILVVSNRVWLVSGRCLVMVCFKML